MDAFDGSLDGFLSSAMLIAVSMLAAAIFVAVKRQVHKVNTNPQYGLIGSGDDVYDISLTFLGAVFSIFPVLVLYAMLREPTKSERLGAGKSWLRRSVLLLIWVGCVLEAFLAPRGEIDYQYRNDSDYDIWGICDLRGGSVYWRGLTAAQYLVFALPLLWLLVTVLLHTGFRIPGLTQLKALKRLKSAWRLGVAWLNLLAMWGILIYFKIYRDLIIKVADGDDTAATHWGFGQIVALAAWVPVIVNFFYVFFGKLSCLLY